jgi:hypothetical protein
VLEITYGGTGRFSGARRSLEDAAGIVELRAVARTIEPAGPIGAHLCLGGGQLQLRRAAEVRAERLPSPCTPACARVCRSSRSRAASRNASPESVSRLVTAFSESSISLVRRITHTGLPRHSIDFEVARFHARDVHFHRRAGRFRALRGPHADDEGTAAATLAAPPAIDVATIRLRLVRSMESLALMGVGSVSIRRYESARFYRDAFGMSTF